MDTDFIHTIGLQPGISIVNMASAADWMALFAKADASDYISVRVIAWAHVTVAGGEANQPAFGAIVPAQLIPGYDADITIFAPTSPYFMCYLGPGQLLGDQFVKDRLASIKRELGLGGT